jgi:signal transduction histidine kinase
MKISNDKTESIQGALMRRARFSIRIRIAIGFLITFLLTFCTTILAMVYISDLVQKQRFIENASDFEFEIQQARRYEKEFFLYNTNLVDALLHIQKARSILFFFEDDMRRILGDEDYEIISDQLLRYGDITEELAALGSRTDSVAMVARRALEPELRKASAKIVIDYLGAVERERLHIRSKISSYKVAAVIGLGLVLVIQVIIASLVIGHVIRPFKRFEQYFKRIANGDFSPIIPIRRYRDEFSDLAVAVNFMLMELDKQQEQIIQSRKMGAIGTLTAGIAHELNNPLNNILITIEAILDGYGDLSDEKKKALLNDAFGQTRRAGDIVKNLLDFSRFRETSFDEMSINEIINTSTSLIANEASLKNIRIRLKLSQDLSPVKVDKNQMQQVFINIFLNAIQAMPDEGELEVESYSEDKYIRVDITDTGPGIPPDILEKIFDPFFTTKDVGKGTGLGLSVAYGIINKHNGSITARSQPGKGTIFSVKLPPMDENKAEVIRTEN